MGITSLKTRVPLVDIILISSVKSTYKGSSCPQKIWIYIPKDALFSKAQKKLKIPADPNTQYY